MTASWLLSDWIRFVTLPPPFHSEFDRYMDLCMILGPKVSVLLSFVAKIVGNDYCVQIPQVREWSVRVCSLVSQRELCAKYGDFK